MSHTKFRLTITILFFLALAFGCNLPSMMSVEPQGEIEDAAIANSSESQPDSLPEPEMEPQPEPAAAAIPAFDTTDLCSVVSPEIAEQVLGQPVEAIEGPGTCLYSNGTASITISLLEGEGAKNSLASQILQLEADCSMSFSYSSDQPDPTPLPPEADPLLAMSLPELTEKSLTLQQSCGGPAFETLPEYGPGVYLVPFELFMPGGNVSIVTDDYSLSILYTDINADADGAVEVARQLLELVVAGE